MTNEKTNGLANNSLLGHYRIVAKIGAGGMGEVYLANDTKLDRKVALKILPKEFAEDADRMNRFVREAKSASALNHPNIITIYEIGESDGTHFIATEFIDGKTLSDYTKSNPLNYKSALEIAIQIASALDEAHAAGIVHRDIKPDNVMVRANGLVKILDFGIAKLVEMRKADFGTRNEEAATLMQTPDTPPSTTSGMIIGTPQFMSPEQARGKDVDHQTDIFSFGVVLYEMLSGSSPFAGETISDTLAAVLTKEPPRLSEIPVELAVIVHKTLQKDKSQRYQTAQDLLADLQAVKQKLQVQNSFENSASASQAEPETQMLRATTADEISQTTTNQTMTSPPKTKYLVPGLLSVVLAVGGFFGYKYLSPTTTQINSIAVLPFENRSGNADSEYLSDGLAESLIYRLSQLPDLKVSPTSSVFRYKGKETDPQTVAKELGVDSVMTGRITHRGDNLTISVNLVDTRNGKSLWGEQYERKMSELLNTQREIASEITNKLQLKLSGVGEQKLTKKYTDNNDAYQLYLKGRFHFAKRTKDDIERGIDYFQQAIQLDPNFALAYARIAEAYNQMPAYPYLSPKEAGPKAKAAAKRALEIDPTLPDAHTALGNALVVFDWNWTEAEREFQKAIELDPNNAETENRYGHILLAHLGRSEEALTRMKHAVELEPLDISKGGMLAWTYVTARQNDKAVEQAKRILELDQNHPLARFQLGQAYTANGMYSEAIDLSQKGLQLDPNSQFMLQVAGFAYAKNGRRAEAENVIKKFKDIEKLNYVAPYLVANIYAALDQRDQAFAELEKAYQEHDWFLMRLKVDPLMDSLRDDPRYKDLLKRMGLPE